MTLAELAEWARWHTRGYADPVTTRVAHAALALLDGPALPCGHTVEACRDAEGSYLRIDGDTMDLESAHGFALAILRKIDERRAADEAEAKEGDRGEAK